LKLFFRSFQNPTVQILVTALICLMMIGLPWAFQAYPFQKQPVGVKAAAPTITPVAMDAILTATPAANLPDYTAPKSQAPGISRQAEVHTTIPAQPAFDLFDYTVQKGDTIFDIASKFGLKPSTILWGNLTRLADNPEMIYPGQKLTILPVNGVLYEWHQGDGLNGVAKGLQVTPEDIINFPGNHLDPQTIGDLTHPNIKVGTQLIIPGGNRNFITWSAPAISRFNPGAARLYGAGACQTPSDGAVGTGTFVFPTVMHWLSGYEYAPEANHPAVDFAGTLDNAIYAADNGVIVYAGWNDHGYGNVTVIDHGNGWQTLYGHQDVIKVTCGQSVYKGDVIGLLGSTGRSSGPHLHFEVWYNGAHVNPHTIVAIGKR
jgi:LysM repeat protein